MCGINFTTVPDKIELMNAKLAHRGLMGRTGVVQDNGWALGHVRLPIVGLGNEWDQPLRRMLAPGHTQFFAFVGELYDFRELDGSAKCDTPLMAELVFSQNWDALRRSDSMFSFIAIEKKGLFTRVMIGVDALGKKPLYWHEPTMSVSSELKALLVLDEAEPEADELYFSNVAKWGYDTHGLTPYRNIKKLNNGSITTLDFQGDELVGFNLSTELGFGVVDGHFPEVEAVTWVRQAITNSVRRRIQADVPVALLLSGGLDSSIIYKIMEGITHDFTIFHVDNSEEEYLNALNIPGDIKVHRVCPRNGAAILDQILWANEGPVDLGSMIPQYMMARAIKEDYPELRVILTGDGADELFGGYRRAAEYDSQFSDVFMELVYYHLPRLDRLSMASTLELRSPFLGICSMLAAFATPYSLRTRKEVLKKAFEDLVPAVIRERVKHPLKSPEVLTRGQEWRNYLIEQYRKLMKQGGPI